LAAIWGVRSIPPQLPFETDPRLREQDWGEWSAKPAEKIQYEEFDKLDEDQKFGWQFCPPGGEERIIVWLKI
jgi:broad specificity phosphatase PhoE